jgi:ribose transport system permease protein
MAQAAEIKLEPQGRKTDGVIAFFKKKEIGIFLLLALVCIATGIKNPNFWSVVNLQDEARLIGMFGIFSVGVGLVIITSGIDLSLGSLFALEGILLAMALTEHHWPFSAGYWPWPVAAVAVIALCAFLGWIHGILVTRANLQPFIVTLCGLLIYRGLARFIATDSTKGFGDATQFGLLNRLATGTVCHTGPFRFELLTNVPEGMAGVPMPFVLFVITAIIFWVVLHRSVYGRYLYAVGRNEDAARYSGINTKRVITSAYVICSGLAGVSGILFAFYTNSISPSTHGNFYELFGIAAAVLGGCSLRGGEGSIIGICIGAALLQVLQNLVNLLGIDSSLNFAVMGTVILLGVLADQLVAKSKKKE